MERQETDVLVVGAGMAGLTAAHHLQNAGKSVLVVEKGSTVGGRMATYHLEGGGVADHGAQYLTARSEEFQQWIEHWETVGLLFLWTIGTSTGSLMRNYPAGHPRYIVPGGMSHLAEHLAAELDVKVGTRIIGIRLRDDSTWEAEAENGTVFVAQALLLTAPVPESLTLLDAGRVVLSQEDRAVLDSIRYAPCLAGIFRYDGQTNLPKPGAVHRPANTIPWMVDNQQKGISQEAVVTLHADPNYSRRYFDSPDMEIVETMQDYMDPYLPEGTHLVEAKIKRWRYSFPEVMHEERALTAKNLPPLVFAGDAFGGAGLEGAFLSGEAAAKVLLVHMDSSSS